MGERWREVCSMKGREKRVRMPLDQPHARLQSNLPRMFDACASRIERERRLTQDWRGCVVRRMLPEGCRLARAGSRRCVV